MNDGTITIDGDEPLTKVTQFKYLGSLVTLYCKTLYVEPMST